MLADLLRILSHCALWSVLSIGGNTVALSDIDRYAVNTVHWLTGAQFVAFFAISQALPGPNGMALVLIGQQAAGLPGAITALIAKLVPTSLMAYSGAAWYERNHERVWVKRLRVALPPVTVGLLLAATFTLARQVDVKASRILMTAVAAAIVYCYRSNPIWIVVASVALGLASVLTDGGWF